MAKAPAESLVGSIEHVGDRWVIRCEPHIRMRIRRLFSQVDQGAGETISISDNPENCRDLLWLVDRHPMAVTGLAHMRRQSNAHVETETLIQRLRAGLVPPQPVTLPKPPREYQLRATQILEAIRGLLLADDTGLGKTYSTILGTTLPGALPVLVVVQSHLKLQWADAFLEFAPHLSVHVIKKGTPYDLLDLRSRNPAPNAPQKGRFPDVLIVSYTMLSGWAETLAPIIRYVAFDEVQELRHQGSLKYKAAKYLGDALAARRDLRLGTSATPIHNLGAEFFSVLDVLSPGTLGTENEFRNAWCKDDCIKDPKMFGDHLRSAGLMLGRTRKEVGRELPPLSVIPHTIQADIKALDEIAGSAVALAKIILADQDAYKGQRFQASEEFNTLLRQATGIAKAPYVAEFVRMLLATEDRVIVFAWHRQVYSILSEMLADFDPVMFTGSESAAQKEASKQAFMSGKSRVMLMSLRSGSGVDQLQHVCTTGVFAELDWSQSVHHQCISRYHRDGQDAPSQAYFLLSDEGCDPVISQVLGIKKAQLEGVRNPDADLIAPAPLDPGRIKSLAEAYLKQIESA